jgi:hypothetical protein
VTVFVVWGHCGNYYCGWCVDPERGAHLIGAFSSSEKAEEAAVKARAATTQVLVIPTGKLSDKYPRWESVVVEEVETDAYTTPENEVLP